MRSAPETSVPDRGAPLAAFLAGTGKMHQPNAEWATNCVLAERCGRRLFCVFNPILGTIGESEGREEETWRVWDTFWPIALDLAEWRLFQKELA